MASQNPHHLIDGQRRRRAGTDAEKHQRDLRTWRNQQLSRDIETLRGYTKDRLMALGVDELLAMACVSSITENAADTVEECELLEMMW